MILLQAAGALLGRPPAGKSLSSTPVEEKSIFNKGDSGLSFPPRAFDRDTISRSTKRQRHAHPRKLALKPAKAAPLRVLESIHIQCFLTSKTC